jgi:capsular polysaccharide transport system permease protein
VSTQNPKDRLGAGGMLQGLFGPGGDTPQSRRRARRDQERSGASADLDNALGLGAGPGSGGESSVSVAAPSRPSATHTSEVVPLPQRRDASGRLPRRIEQRLTVVPAESQGTGAAPPATAFQLGAASAIPVPPIAPRQPEEDAPLPRVQALLPPLPEAVTSRASSLAVSFALCVVLPVILATLYFSFIASPQYVAEFRFTVKDTTTSAASSQTGSLLSMIGVSGGSSTENYLVADFLTSREAAEALEKRINVKELFAKPGIDWWSRFESSRPMEEFVPYWQKMVKSSYDQITGIAVATVRAFSPEDALLIAGSLVTLSEELVNQISNRSRSDAVKFAQQEVIRAEERLRAIRAKLSDYRSRVGVIDPATSVVASNSTLIQTLRSNLAALETQLATLKLQNMSASAPVVVGLQNQIRSTKEQIQAVEQTVGKSVDGRALSAVIGEYEQLDMERQFAQTMLASAATALDQARASANAQHLYITPYVRPSLPQSATYPRVFLSVLTVAAFAFGFWIAGLMIVRSIRERFH